MTQKTIHKRAKSKFSMINIRKRSKKLMRKRYKKTIKKNFVDKVWKDWVEIMIVEPLIKDGFVQVDKHFSLEIVGTRVSENKRVFALLSNGLMYQRGGGVKKAPKLNPLRNGFTYRIVMKENRYKHGKLIFEAHPYIKKRVHEALVNTNKYYRIESNGN